LLYIEYHTKLKNLLFLANAQRYGYWKFCFFLINVRGYVEWNKKDFTPEAVDIKN
jgi:hypothetical protein